MAVKEAGYVGVRTPGHVVGTAFDSRVYYKPSINRLVIRTKGVLRTSEKVLARNEAVARAKPAKACGRKGPGGTRTPMREFRRCLREQMKKL